jgi:predicted ATPase
MDFPTFLVWAQLGRSCAPLALGETNGELDAESLLNLASFSGALEAADDAIRVGLASGEICYLPESRRLRAAALAALGNRDEAEKELLEGITIARRHQTKSWELRRAITMHDIFGEKGRLADVLASFTEGFDTQDLKRAREVGQTARSAAGRPAGSHD